MTDNSAKPKLAVVGAGPAGLACAVRLSDRFAVTVFDKSRGLSGRMSTRRAEAHAFDHGAQYFRATDPRFADWLAPLRADGTVALWSPVAVRIDRQGIVTAAADEAEKLVVAPAMNRFGKVLAAAYSDIKIETGRPVTALSGGSGAWRLDGEDSSAGPFAQVVLAVPAPQAAALLPPETAFGDALAAVRMAGCHTLMLGYAAGEAVLPQWQCAHFDDDMLGFAAVNDAKPGRSGGAALVVQTRHDWSEAHIEDDLDAVAALVKQRFAELTGLPVAASGYDRLHRWRYASTPVPAGTPFLHDAALGLSAVGDWCTGSKVQDAVLNGDALAAHLLGAPA